MPSTGILQMAKEVVELREKVQAAKAVYEEIKNQLDDTELNLYQQMDIEGVQNFKMENVGTIYCSARPWTSVTDMEKAQAYFKEKGLFDEIFHLDASSKRLNEFVKENFIEKREPIPEEAIGINVVMKQSIGIRRG